MQNRDKLCPHLATSLQMQAGKGGGKAERIWEHRVRMRRLDHPEVIPLPRMKVPKDTRAPWGQLREDWR